MRRYTLALPLAVWLLTAFLVCSSPLAATPELLVVRIRAATPADTLRLARSGLDLLETRSGDDLLAIVDQQTLTSLSAAGWDVRIDAAQTALLAPPPVAAQGTAGYATVDEIEDTTRQLANDHPGLATLVDYGDTYRKSIGAGGDDLLALRLTNKALGGEKPVFFLMAAIHAREIATDDVALRFARWLLEGYGRDAEATFLLDEHEIVVVPLANPDGRRLVDAYNYYQRKNVRPTGACQNSIYDQSGVDLNRNSSFRWGRINSPTNTPGCSPTYPGLAAASEPETASLETLIRSRFRDQRGPGDGDAAPLDTSGVLVSLHSYGELVLWPWGASASGPAPNAAGLEQLGRQLAARNGYEAYQSFNLYDTSGTTDDWAYGELGVASFTFEIGPSAGRCGGFFPPYSCLDGEQGGAIWQRNFPALRYAATISRAPYLLPGGPDVDAVGTRDSGSVTLTVTLRGSDSPVAAEAYLDGPPWRGGTPIALRPADGAFDEPVEQAEAALGTGTSRVRRLALVRARNAAGTWGPFAAAFVSTPLDLPYRSLLPLVVQ